MHCYHGETPGAVALPDEDMLHFGAAAGLPTILNMRYKPDTDLCTAVCRRAGLNAMIVENSGQGCVTPQGAAEGLRVLINLARYMNMLPGEPDLPQKTVLIDQYRDDDFKGGNVTTSISQVTASSTGMFIPHRFPFEIVEKGDLLGQMLDLYTGEITQTVHAPVSGCLYSAGASLGVCKKGQRLIGVAIYESINPREVLDQQ